MSIKIFTTGGTIDDIDYDKEEQTPEDRKSLIPYLLEKSLEKSRVSIDYKIEDIFLKDSRFIDNKDREFLKEKCENCLEEKIIITHGSLTMATTAKYLGKNKLEKTIVLVGAIIPANKNNSDALFNLGFAFASVQLLPYGVYVAMNGKIFLWDNVKKNLDTGFFEIEK